MLTLLLIGMLTLAFNIQPIHAQPETTLYVDPSTTTILVDEDFSINVTVAEVADLSAFSFRLGYSTTILDFVNVWIPPGWETPIIILEPEGYVYVSATSPVSFFGTAVLALISFHATAVGECLLDLCDTTLFDSASDFIPHTIIDGSVTISSILGDVNGDGIVDIFDALVVKHTYWSKPGDPNWVPECDLNQDDIVNSGDALILILHFGETIP